MTKLRPQTRPTEDGFTLVEVMIALVILAMMSALIAGALQLHARALSRSEQSELLSEQRRLLDVAAIKLGTPVAAQALSDSEETPVLGTSSSVAVIVEPEIAAIGLPGFARYELHTKNSETCPQQKALTLRRSPVWPGDLDVSPYTQERLLLDCVQTLSLSYYGRLSTARDAAWHQSWNESLPPKAIRIEIVSKSLAYERWLSLPNGGI